MASRVVCTVDLPGAQDTAKIVNEAGFEFLTRQWHNGEDELIELTTDADAIIMLSYEPFTERVIEQLRRCRVISAVGIGYDNVNLDAATERGICVCNNPHYCLEEVSDHAMALLLACARKIVRVHNAVKEGAWTAPAATSPRCQAMLPPMFKLSGQTLGLVGFGNIARHVVPKAKGFGMRIIAYAPHLQPDVAEQIGVQAVDLSTLLEQSDVVSLHAPLTPQNRHMLGAKEFQLMKPTAYLINTARGGLVDEQALYTALCRGQIAGAGLDCLDPEPPDPSNPLLTEDNVVVTTHMAAYSVESLKELWRVPGQEVVQTLVGGWPAHLVNPQVKETYRHKWR